MKPFRSFPLLLLVSLSGVASLPAQENPATKPVAPPAGAPAAASNTTTTTVTEERTTTVVYPDPTLDKLEGKVVRIDGEKKQLLLRTKNANAPIPYTVNLATKFVDLDGLPVDPALIIAEVPVEVRYVENGPELMASSVIVQRYQAPVPGGGVTLTTRETLKAGGKVVEDRVKTTATSRTGTLGSMENGILTVVGDATSAPQRYQYSKTTQWVNAIGEPLPIATINPGYTVTVTYSQRGDAVFADRIVVQPPDGTAAPGGVRVPATTPGTAPTPTQGALPAPLPGADPGVRPAAVPQNPARN